MTLDHEIIWIVRMEREINGEIVQRFNSVLALSKTDAMNRAEREYKGAAVSAWPEDWADRSDC